MSDRRFVHLTVRGRVQGVGFRAFVEDEALRRGLDGWVRNRRDGTVEAAVAGPPEEIDSWITALRQGPPGSRVDGMETKEADKSASGTGPGFSVLPTV
jgi:acylphosphatase